MKCIVNEHCNPFIEIAVIKSVPAVKSVPTVTWKRLNNKQSRNPALTCRSSFNYILLDEDHDGAKFARIVAHKNALPRPLPQSFLVSMSSYVFSALGDILHVAESSLLFTFHQKKRQSRLVASICPSQRAL